MMNIFTHVKEALASRLSEVLAELLPNGRVQGREYVCGSLQGGEGTSCLTNLDTGKGSDFATSERWGDIIALAAKVWNVRQYEAAQELAKMYGIGDDWKIGQQGVSGRRQECQQSNQQGNQATRNAITPVLQNAKLPPSKHGQYGAPSRLWAYVDAQNRIMHYVARFETAQGKVIVPLSYGQQGSNSPRWSWKALPAPRPLYNLHRLTQVSSHPVLIVEGEKTADAAQELIPYYVVTTWSGGAQAIKKADWSPLHGRSVVLWPDNDEAGHKAAVDIAKELEGKASSVHGVILPDSLPTKWDLADDIPKDFSCYQALQDAVPVDEFLRHAYARYPNLRPRIEVITTPPIDDFPLKSWPTFSWEACPDFLGDFVRLATRESEADPAAVCITTLVRFGAEVFAFGDKRGPHIFVGETAHPPRLFAVICGNSSKARKGTSRYPVTTLFGRTYCDDGDLHSWNVALPAKESGGPLSTGEGLAFHVREETEEERNRQQKSNPHLPLRDRSDKRLMISDEEFATALSCIKREGNTLSMGIRCFWDSGDYAPLTKNNPITVKGAHINIVTHITMQELALCLDEVQAVNGFGNRFLWICARRSKLVALPPRMPEAEIAPMQRELWRLVGLAQNRGLMKMNAQALELWKTVYPELSKEHNGFAGSIINRAEAQTLRLALVYALLAGQDHIAEQHLQAALSMWRYAQESALYIFSDKGRDPLEEKVLRALQNGALTATDLNNALQRHVPRERLQPLLQQLEAQQKITIIKEKGAGRPRTLLALSPTKDGCEKRKLSEKSELCEKRVSHDF